MPAVHDIWHHQGSLVADRTLLECKPFSSGWQGGRVMSQAAISWSPACCTDLLAVLPCPACWTAERPLVEADLPSSAAHIHVFTHGRAAAGLRYRRRLQEGDVLRLSSVAASQHFTKPPSHFSEAALIKAMEQHGIGRPATYAPVLKALQVSCVAARQDPCICSYRVGVLWWQQCLTLQAGTWLWQLQVAGVLPGFVQDACRSCTAS